MALEALQAAAQREIEKWNPSHELLRSFGKRQEEIDRLFQELEAFYNEKKNLEL